MKFLRIGVITSFMVVVVGMVALLLTIEKAALQNVKSIALGPNGDGWHLGVLSEMSIESDRHLIIHLSFEGVCRDQCYFEVLGKRTKEHDIYKLAQFSSNRPEGYASLRVNAPGVDELAVSIAGLDSKDGAGKIEYSHPHEEWPVRLILERIFYRTYGVPITPASFNRAVMYISATVGLVTSLLCVIAMQCFLSGRRKGVSQL